MEQHSNEPQIVEQNGSFVRIQAGVPAAPAPIAPGQVMARWNDREVYRTEVRGDETTTTVERPSSSRDTVSIRRATVKSSEVLATAKDGAGFAWTGPLNDSALITDPVAGEMQLGAAVALGWARQTETGYEWLGVDGVPSSEADPASNEQPKAEDQEEKPTEEQDPDWKDTIEGKIEGTSDDTDALLVVGRARLSEAMQSGVISAVVEGKSLESFLPEAASAWGMEPEQASNAFDAAYADFDRGARAAAAAVGVQDYDNGFWPWLASDPDRAHKAISSLLQYDPREFQRYARQYQRAVTDGALAAPQATPAGSQAQAEPALGDVPAAELKSLNPFDLASAQTGKGISRIDTDSSGTLTLYLQDGRSMPLDDAIDSGLVRVSRVPHAAKR